MTKRGTFVGLIVLALSFVPRFAFAASPPSVETIEASDVTLDAGTLNGVVNPNGTPTMYHFDWGTTTEYGNSTDDQDAGTGTADVDATDDIIGLTQGTVYHFRLVAVTDAGNVNGNDVKFEACGNCGDFTVDGKPDIFWRNRSSLRVLDWFMNGTHVVSQANIDGLDGNPGSDWVPFAKADLDGDGVADVLWHNVRDGRVVFWLMNGPHFLADGELELTPSVGTAWVPVAVADFDADGSQDVLWHNNADGRTVIWYLDGAAFRDSTSVDGTGRPAVAWSPVAAQDFDKDGLPDILWHNSHDGRSVIWYMHGPHFQHSARIDGTGAPPTDWVPVSSSDFNGNGAPDVLWHNRVSGRSVVWFLQGPHYVSKAYLDGAGTPSRAWQPL